MNYRFDPGARTTTKADGYPEPKHENTKMSSYKPKERLSRLSISKYSRTGSWRLISGDSRLSGTRIALEQH